RFDRLALDGGPDQRVVQNDVQLQVAAQAVPDPGEVERGPRDLFEAQHVRVELAGFGHVGDRDAHVRELLEEAHAVLLGAVRIAHFHCGSVIFGAQVSHSFWGLSCRTKIAPSLTGVLSDSGVAKEMPPATRDMIQSARWIRALTNARVRAVTNARVRRRK